jgi:catechol 2,3-dioxygenase-like lactoylglutathione lyase family enzyme
MIERIDHVNLVVHDMQGMIAFYTDVLGMQLTRQAVISGPWIESVTGLSPAEAEVAFLEAGTGSRIEMIHYRKPESIAESNELSPPNIPGFRHIAFRVHGIEQLVASIEAAGCKMFSPVQKVPAAQVDFGDRSKYLAYCRDPEGNLLELCEFR